MKCLRLRLFFLFLIGFLVCVTPNMAGAQAKLPALNADLSQTTVSGLSSGAFMAGQFHIAHSGLVKGAGLVAGGLYACAESWQARTFPYWPWIELYSAAQAVNGCMQTRLRLYGVPTVGGSLARARELAQRGKIDPVANLTNDRIYLFSGGKDETVLPYIVESVERFYRRAGVDEKQILFQKDERAGHSFITTDKGNNCETSKKPYLVRCGYDQAGALLKHLLGPLKEAGARTDGTFLPFDQTEFLGWFSDYGLSEKGFVFIPKECGTTTGKKCRVHIVFHGCSQSWEVIGEKFVRGAGFWRWAVSNRLIVLFPQTKAKSSGNQYGCWDWWGYSGLDYLSKNARQIKAVHKMLQRLGKAP